MRIITKDAGRAFIQNKPFRRANTEVRVEGNEVRLLLHNNNIAVKDKDTGEVVYSMCGWGTPVTRERLNGLLSLMGHATRLYQHKHAQYIFHMGQSVPIHTGIYWCIDENYNLKEVER